MPCSACGKKLALAPPNRPVVDQQHLEWDLQDLEQQHRQPKQNKQRNPYLRLLHWDFKI